MSTTRVVSLAGAADVADRVGPHVAALGGGALEPGREPGLVGAPVDVVPPVTGSGRTSLIRWSQRGPSTPKSARSGPPSSTRTKVGLSRSTETTSTSASSIGQERRSTLIGSPGRGRVRDGGGPTGTTSGVCETGSSMTRLSRPKTVRTSVLGHHLARRALGDDPPGVQRDEVVGVAGGQVEVVQHHHDGGAAALVEVGEEVEHLDLVGDVEVRRRLVEQQQVGALGERHRDPHPLALAAGQLVDDAVGQVEGVGEGRAPRRPRPRPRPVHRPKAPWCGWRPRRDEVGDRDALGRDRVLREQPQRAGDLLGREPVDRLAVEQHRAGARAQQPRQPAEQGGLAAGVGARRSTVILPVRDPQVEVAYDVGVAVAERQGARLQPGGGR